MRYRNVIRPANVLMAVCLLVVAGLFAALIVNVYELKQDVPPLVIIAKAKVGPQGIRGAPGADSLVPGPVGPVGPPGPTGMGVPGPRGPVGRGATGARGPAGPASCPPGYTFEVKGNTAVCERQ